MAWLQKPICHRPSSLDAFRVGAGRYHPMRPVALGALRNPCAREGARSRGALARSRGVATALLAREFLTAMESYKLNGALARTDFVCKACIELVGF